MSPRAAGSSGGEAARKLRVIRAVRRAYPEAACALSFRDPLQLLVATVLSAQCTDTRVNLVTRELFKRFRKPEDYLAVPIETIEEAIRSTGFFKNKAKAIQGICRTLIRDHAGAVPSTLEELVALPGVGRKTANVVLGEGFGIASGIVVDTHVHRLSRRLALTRADDPVKIERDLMEIVPRPDWLGFGMRLITHGRTICPARKPSCPECLLLPDCPFGLRETRGAQASPARVKGGLRTRKRPATEAP